MSAHICPRCGTPRGAHGGPVCTCAQDTADAVRDIRTAEAAAAEDFDPLRIRPYVSLPDAEDEPPYDHDHDRDRDHGHAHDQVGSEAPALPVRHSAAGSAQLAPAPRAAPPPTDLDPVPSPAPAPRPRRRRAALLSVAGAAVAVVAVTAAASGLFGGAPEREHALPDRRTTAPSTSPLTSAPGRTRTPSASPEAAAPPSARAEVAPSRSAAPPTRATSGAAPPPTASATGAIGTPRAPAAPVLKPGDEGPEVRELQDRLRQTFRYAGPSDGRYDLLVEDAVTRYQYERGIDADPRGVYGPATRKALEAETAEPGGSPDR